MNMITQLRFDYAVALRLRTRCSNATAIDSTGREMSSPYIDKPGILTPIFHSISGVHVHIVQQLLPVSFRVLYLP